MNNGPHDFDVAKQSEFKDNRKFPSSGLKAGIESGLSMVENLPRGNVEAQQQANTSNFRQECSDEALGSKNGKGFTVRY